MNTESRRGQQTRPLSQSGASYKIIQRSYEFHHLLEMRVRRPTPACGVQVRVCAPAKSLQLCQTLWTVACQAPLSTGLYRQGNWSGLPCPPPRNLPGLGMEAVTHVSCIGRWVLYHYHPGKPGMQGHKRVTVVAEGKKVPSRKEISQ